MLQHTNTKAGSAANNPEEPSLMLDISLLLQIAQIKYMLTLHVMSHCHTRHMRVRPCVCQNDHRRCHEPIIGRLM